MSSFWKLAPYAAGGVAMSALENKVLGSNLPDPLKKINLGIGATQGAMFALPGEKSKMLALGSIPTKQMGLFALGEAEKFKNEQESLVNTNLSTAKVNETAAKLHLRDAGTSRAIQLAFLIPALIGAGALGYGAYNQFKKNKKPGSKFKNLAETGEHKPNQKLRMEMPMSALPKDFVPSLLSAQRAHLRVQEKEDDTPTVRKPRSKAASSLLQGAGTLAMGLTGIPEFLRGGKDLAHSFFSTQDSDYGNAARYAGSGLGNLALGVVGARLGLAPALGFLLGKARLGGVIRNALRGESKQLTEMPTLAKWVYRQRHLVDWPNKARESLTLGKLPAVNAYDPQRYAWQNPTTGSSLFKGLFTAPSSGAGPKSLLGTTALGAKYVGNRAINAGYAGRQLARRWPNVTLSAFGLPLANRGTERDESEMAQQKEMWDKWTPHGENFGPMGMPVSSVAGGIIRAMSGSREPIAQQLGG